MKKKIVLLIISLMIISFLIINSLVLSENPINNESKIYEDIEEPQNLASFNIKPSEENESLDGNIVESNLTEIESLDGNIVESNLTIIESLENNAESRNLKVLKFYDNNSSNSTYDKLLEELINDTYLPSEGLLETVALWKDSWILHAIIRFGNNPQGMTELLPFGFVSKERTADCPQNTRVQLKDMKTYFLINGEWILYQETSNYREVVNDWKNGLEPMERRDVYYNEKRGEIEGFSYMPEGNWTIHWWARDADDIRKSAYIPLPPSYDGIFVTIKAKLIMNNTSKSSDIDDAKYILILGGDYYPKPSEGPRGTAFAIGRGKYVTEEWNTYHVISLTEDEIRENPPPLEI